MEAFWSFFVVVVVMDMVNRNVYLKLITPDFFC